MSRKSFHPENVPLHGQVVIYQVVSHSIVRLGSAGRTDVGRESQFLRYEEQLSVCLGRPGGLVSADPQHTSSMAQGILAQRIVADPSALRR